MEDIKDSVLWGYAEEEFKKLSLNEKIRYHGKVYFPDKEELSLDDKIKVIMKIPGAIEILCEHLDDREAGVLKKLSMGYSYREVCKDLGYTSRSSVRIMIKNVRRQLLEMLQ